MSFLMSRTLKTTLLVDAAVSGGAAVILAAGSFVAAGLLGLPAPLMLWVGVALIPWVVALGLIGRGERASKAVIYTIIAANLAWVAASFWVAFGPVFAPTLPGKVFVVVQALTVLGFAEFQMLGLKRSAAAA